MSEHVLLVDDEVDFTELTKTLIGFHGYEVEALNDPLQVEARCLEKKFDIIIVDLMMPGIDGFLLIEKLRKIKTCEKTPVIVLSAKILTDAERKRLLQNEAHFITKPFEPQTLVENILNLLGTAA